MIDSGRGLIERTGFEGPVLEPLKVRIKNPGVLKGRRKKLNDHVYGFPKGVIPPVHNYWKSLQVQQISRLRGQPGFANTSRYGVPDGMRKADAMKIWQEARQKAVNTLIEMVEKGIL